MLYIKYQERWQNRKEHDGQKNDDERPSMPGKIAKVRGAVRTPDIRS
jgi:hypothetical protein